VIHTLTSAIRWFARVEGTLIAAMVFLFVFGEGFGNRGTYTLNPFVLSAADFASISLLMIACIGLLLAWRWEARAGAATVICMVVRLFVRPGFPLCATLAILVPGVLFLVTWFMTRHQVA
jgi:hypothetical protein